MSDDVDRCPAPLNGHSGFVRQLGVAAQSGAQQI